MVLGINELENFLRNLEGRYNWRTDSYESGISQFRETYLSDKNKRLYRLIETGYLIGIQRFHPNPIWYAVVYEPPNMYSNWKLVFSLPLGIKKIAALNRVNKTIEQQFKKRKKELAEFFKQKKLQDKFDARKQFFEQVQLKQISKQFDVDAPYEEDTTTDSGIFIHRF